MRRLRAGLERRFVGAHLVAPHQVRITAVTQYVEYQAIRFAAPKRTWSTSLAATTLPSHGAQSVDHLGSVLDSLVARYRYLNTLLDRPFAHGDGTLSFHLLDPTGNKVQPIHHPALSGQRFSLPG